MLCYLFYPFLFCLSSSKTRSLHRLGLAEALNDTQQLLLQEALVATAALGHLCA